MDIRPQQIDQLRALRRRALRGGGRWTEKQVGIAEAVIVGEPSASGTWQAELVATQLADQTAEQLQITERINSEQLRFLLDSQGFDATGDAVLWYRVRPTERSITNSVLLVGLLDPYSLDAVRRPILVKKMDQDALALPIRALDHVEINLEEMGLT